jgi:hypothetical protein
VVTVVGEGSASPPAPLMNLSLRSGTSIVPPPSVLVIPVVPSHTCHPVGTFVELPYHIAINPIGVLPPDTPLISTESALIPPSTRNL